MQENLETIKAFDVYYAMGKERTLKKTAESTGWGFSTIEKWSADFRWQDKIIQRDIEVGQKMMAETNRLIVKEKQEYRTQIKQNLKIIRGAIMSVFQDMKDKDGKPITDANGNIRKEMNLKVANAFEMNQMIIAFNSLIKIDLQLLGESTEGGTLQIPKTFSEMMLQMRIKK